MTNNVTKLRYVCSKNPERIIKYVNRDIPYRVEIKGNVTFADKKWYLWFNLPDPIEKEMYFGDLDNI